MSVTAEVLDQPVETAGSSDVRLVVVDPRQQPRYLNRAHELEQAILRVAATAGMLPHDMPGLSGLCIAAARAAETAGR